MATQMTYNSITGGYNPAELLRAAQEMGLGLPEFARETARGLVGNTITPDEVDEAARIILREMEMLNA